MDESFKIFADAERRIIDALNGDALCPNRELFKTFNALSGVEKEAFVLALMGRVVANHFRPKAGVPLAGCE